MKVFKNICVLFIFCFILNSFSFAQTVIDTIEISNASDIVINSDTNRIYVVGSENDIFFKSFVSVIDGGTNEVIDTIFFDKKSVSGVAVNPLTNRIYITVLAQGIISKITNNSSFVKVVDGDTNRIIDSIKMGSIEAAGVAVNIATNKVYVTGTKGFSTKEMFVNIIDGDANEIVDSINLGNGFISSVAVNPGTNRIYVKELVEDPSGKRKTIVGVIDGITNELIDTIEFEACTGDIAVNEVTNRIYLTETQGCSSDNINDFINIVNVIDGVTNTVVASLELEADFISAVTVNPKTNRIYAGTGTIELDETSSGIELAQIIDGESHQLIGSIEVGNPDFQSSSPFSLSMNITSNQIYASIIGGFVKVVQDDL